MTKKVKPVKLRQEVCNDMKATRPYSSFDETITEAWQMYKSVQDAGRWMYGKKNWNRKYNK